jgi:DNA uptake protein ComE-like DNA-binding protein
MKKYILKRTFVTHDGSVYQARQKPYLEGELPELALSPAFAELVDDGTVLTEAPKPVERNVVDAHYNGVENKNVIEQHFQPSFAEPEVKVEPVFELDIKHLNAPDHVVDAPKPVVLGSASVVEIAALPYISRKTAERLLAALADGQTFNSYEDLDKAFKLGFGKSWADSNLVLPTVGE